MGKLNTCVNGIVQGPRMFNKKTIKKLRSLGYKEDDTNECVFTKWVTVWVNEEKVKTEELEAGEFIGERSVVKSKRPGYVEMDMLILAFIHVDDFKFWCDRLIQKEFEVDFQNLVTTYGMRDEGTGRVFLSIRSVHTLSGIELDQQSYCESIIEEFGQDCTDLYSVPGQDKVDPEETNPNPKIRQRAIRSS